MLRIFDLIFSFIGVILLLPFLIIIGLLVFFTSKGGVFYTQERIGKNGKPFLLLKFRTMKNGSDKKGLLTVGENDKRITRIGRVLRKYKVDEFPQLLNVLFGSMSLVGPRPEVRKYVDLYTEEQRNVLKVKPGITDYASVYYIDENKLLSIAEDPEIMYIEEIMPDKIRWNMVFINKPTITNYFNVIWLTIDKLLKKLITRK
jgi:lipopolysaccharide/colanic/teichoic acid biosynthesis glycosyltransferase